MKPNLIKSIRILTALAFLAIIVIILFADFRIIPKKIFSLYDFPYGDKVGHFFLMGLFALLVNMSLNMHKISVFSVSILLGSLIVVILTTVEEFSQSFFPSRTASIFDLAASCLGIFLIGNLSIWIPALKPANKN
jgi:polysaccharide biosynthesis protein VpsQ